jgi:gluconolactonase
MAPNDESDRDQKSAPQTTPAFSIYDAAFESILGPSPSLTLLLEKEYAFAHEAGVFIEATNELFITSNRLVDKMGQQTVEVSKISLEGSPKCEVIKCDQLVMANGGVNYEHNRILFCTQGSASQPSGLFLMDVEAPHGTELMVAGFHGRPFNSVNDVVVHSDGSVWFTDPIYGYEQGYRPKPRLPNQVYRYEPQTGDIRVVADGFGRPNGICFSPDERTVYVTDTDWIHGDGTTDDSRPSTM